MIFLSFFGTIYTLKQINEAVFKESIQKQVESALWQAQEAIDYRKRAALSISLALSKSPMIKEAYISSNREMIFEKSDEYIKQSHELGEIDLQFHTKDLKAWARSWDEDSYGMELSSFRKGLVHVKQSKEPYVSIELGKRLNIKAISPIIIKDEFLGSVEAIVGFESLEKSLKEKGIDFIVLLNRDHLEIAQWEKSKERAGEYVIVCQTTKGDESIRKFAKESLFDDGFLEDGERVYGFLPLFNIDATPLGYFGVALKKNEVKHRQVRQDEPMLLSPDIVGLDEELEGIEIR